MGSGGPLDRMRRCLVLLRELWIENFGVHPRALRDQCMHIRLMLDPVCNASIRDFLAPFPDGYPKSTASPVFFQGLGLAEGRKFRRVPRRGAAAEDQEDGWVDAESFWHARVWPSVEDALVSVTMLGRASFGRWYPRSYRSTYAP